MSSLRSPAKSCQSGRRWRVSEEPDQEFELTQLLSPTTRRNSAMVPRHADQSAQRPWQFSGLCALSSERHEEADAGSRRPVGAGTRFLHSQISTQHAAVARMQVGVSCVTPFTVTVFQIFTTQYCHTRFPVSCHGSVASLLKTRVGFFC